jgi:cytochrome c oxidase subunit IV
MNANGTTPEHAAGHSPSPASLLLVYVGLLALTGLTVALAGVDLGRWIIISALGIASAKTVMVLNTFMHLKYEDRLFRVFVGVAVLTLTIFFVLTFFDYAFH